MNKENTTIYQIPFADHKLYSERITAFKNDTNSPTLVFLHDSWGCTEMWGDFPEVLSAYSGLNALVYDRRGYGKSSPFGITKRTNYYLHDEADVLIKVLDHFGIREVVLYGHSDGATIALIAAARYPKRVKGLIVEGAHSFIEESGKDSVRASRERAKTTSLLKSLEKFHGDKTPELFRLWHETWLNDGFASWTIVPLLSQIQCPVLAFQGEHDEFGTVKQLTILKETIPAEVTMVEIPDAAHTPRREAADVSMRLIKDYFDKYKFSYR